MYDAVKFTGLLISKDTIDGAIASKKKTGSKQKSRSYNDHCKLII